LAYFLLQSLLFSFIFFFFFLRVGDVAPFTYLTIDFCEQLENFYSAIIEYITPSISLADASSSITESLFKYFNEQIQKLDLDFQQAIQLTIDIHYIYLSRSYFNEMIELACGNIPSLPFNLLCDMRILTLEPKIGTIGSVSVQNIISANVPALLNSSEEPTQPGKYIKEIITYLLDFLQLLQPLPIDSSVNTTFKLNQLASESLLSVITSDTVKHISYNGLRQLFMDFDFLKKYMDTDERLRPGTFHYDQILQICNLILMSSFDKFFNKTTRMTEFYLIDPNILLTILQKMLEEKGIFGALTRDSAFNSSIKHMISKLKESMKNL